MNPTNCKLILLDDFSANTENVFSFVPNFSNDLIIKFILLHIVDKEQEAQMKKDNYSFALQFQRFESRAEDFSEKYSLNIETIIQKGTIFETIPKIADNEKADLILFNSPGISKFQERIGSNAFRLIEKSNVPVAIVHSNCPMKIEKIVTNTKSNINNIVDLFKLPTEIIEKLSAQTKIENALIVYEIPKSALHQKEEQKNIEHLIFNQMNLPVICLKK